MVLWLNTHKINSDFNNLKFLKFYFRTLSLVLPGPLLVTPTLPGISCLPTSIRIIRCVTLNLEVMYAASFGTVTLVSDWTLKWLNFESRKDVKFQSTGIDWILMESFQWLVSKKIFYLNFLSFLNQKHSKINVLIKENKLDCKASKIILKKIHWTLYF